MADKDLTRRCDAIIRNAATEMQAAGLPSEIVMDRMLTYCAANIVSWEGTLGAAATFRLLAARIETGILDHLAGAGRHTQQ